jgi:hypothetical protein
MVLCSSFVFAGSSSFLPSPDELDYRDYMGENWLTPVKHQYACGSCWAFGFVASVEGKINLLYNKHLDIDLSEQQLVSEDADCCGYCGDCGGGGPSSAFTYMRDVGIADEACFPYTAENSPCNLCVDWQQRRWKLDNWVWAGRYPYLYTYGPAQLVFLTSPTTGHLVSAVGYNKFERYWIFKNSWGADWGEEGYGKISGSGLFQGLPLDMIPPNPIEALCTDKDNDGYCYWGKSDDVSNCSFSCIINSTGSFLKDEDDNNPNIHTIVDLWISGIEWEESVVVEEPHEIKINVSFLGNEDQIISTQINLSDNNELYETRDINIEHGETQEIIFNWTPTALLDHELKISCVSPCSILISLVS